MESASLRKSRQRVAVELCAGSLLLTAIAIMLSLPLGATLAALAVVAIIAALVLRFWPAASPLRGLGHANRVTYLRGLLIALIAGSLVVPEWLRAHALLCCVLSLLALLLDGVDGAVARRTQTASPFGAAFDMELDAFFVLVMSLACWLSARAGIWVLAIGLMRYALLAAAAAWPRLRGDVPPSFFAKLVCVIQLAALLLALAPWTPTAATAPVLATALLLLACSFGRDLIWLLGRQQHAQVS